MTTVSDPERDVKILLTAQEAYPEFERQFLAAEHDITACLRIFDPWTELLSDEARAVGDHWFDLIEHTLSRGVRITLTISDFDPIVRPDFHQRSWNTLRAVLAAGEASRRPDLLFARTSMHPARAGLLPRLLLWPGTLSKISKTVKRVNTLRVEERQKFVDETPFLRRQYKVENGKLTRKLWPIPTPMPVTHHQKIAVFDAKRVYVGGLDLDNRRYDTPEHIRAAEQTWHDTQLLITGPEARDALSHISTFETVTRGQNPPALAHLLRTISKARKSMTRLAPVPVVQTLSKKHFDEIDASDDLIYLETQYFRDTSLADALAERARKDEDISLILILPGAPEDVAFEGADGSDAKYGEYLQAKCVKTVMDAFGERCFIGSPVQPRQIEPDGRATLYGSPLIYLHAKVSIFDQRAAIVSSANLNGRSMSWDTEAGVHLTEASEVSTLTRRCFAHWLGKDAPEKLFDRTTIAQSWYEMAKRNARGDPLERQGFLVPYASGPARRFGRNLPGVPEEIV